LLLGGRSIVVSECTCSVTSIDANENQFCVEPAFVDREGSTTNGGLSSNGSMASLTMF